MKKLSLIIIGLMALPFSAFADQLNAVECSKLNDLIEMYNQQDSWGKIGKTPIALSPQQYRASYSDFSDEELKTHGVTDAQLAELKKKYEPKPISMSEAEIALKKAEEELRQDEEKKWELEQAAEEKKWKEEKKAREVRIERQKKELTAAFKQNDCAKHLKGYYSLPIIQELKKEWDNNRKNDE